MKVRIPLAVAAALLCFTSDLTAARVQADDLAATIARSVTTYTRYTVFDDVRAQLDNTVVTLTGKVTTPGKRGDWQADRCHRRRHRGPQRDRRPLGITRRRRAAPSRCARYLRKRRVLALCGHAHAADPHPRGTGPRYAHRRSRQRQRPCARPLTGHRPRGDVAQLRADNRARLAVGSFTKTLGVAVADRALAHEPPDRQHEQDHGGKRRRRRRARGAIENGLALHLPQC